MKHLKKIAGFLLALVMVFTMTTNTLAAPEGDLTGGTITINNAVVDQTYKVYQILYLESYNQETGAYSYKANSVWAAWLKDTAKDYVAIDANGYVTWEKEADVVAFAKLAQSYAKSITADATKKAESSTVTFEGLNLGYYLVDTTLGTLCSLDTINPNVTMKEKNAVPTIDKEVEEDSTGEYGKSNDADLKQTINFCSTITAQAGAENYIFHDTMEKGLSFKEVTGITLNDNAVDAENYEVTRSDIDCTFEVKFTQNFCDTLKANDKIVISYTANLNNDAVVGLPGNENKSQLEYGEGNKTEFSKTVTYTWDMEILKYGNGDETKVLAGAEFKLLNKTKDKAAKFENGKFVEWVDEADGTVLKTDENGKIRVEGLDDDTYYLKETKAPDGYNKLSKDEEVVIKRATKGDNETLTYTTVIAKVNNQSGTELPSTGGIGTTVFYAAGSVLVIAAVVLLITKKRMSTK